jgi:branched-chain amino acid transport system permease protein
VFLQLLVAALTLGLVYAVIALGFQIVARGSDVFNFAHGELVAIATLVYFSLAVSYRIPGALAVVITVVVVTVLAVVLERIALSPMRVREPLTLAMLTVGLATLLRGVMILVWGHDVFFAPPLLGGAPFTVGGASIARANVVLVLACLAVLAGLYIVFARTLWGKKILAAAANPEAAKLVGVEPSSTRLAVFLLAGLMTGVAGALIAPVTFAYSGSGFNFVLKAFAAALLGGIDRFEGSLVGGVALGVLEAFIAGYVSSAFREPLVLGVVIVTLMIRPSGLLGGKALRIT